MAINAMTAMLFCKTKTSPPAKRLAARVFLPLLVGLTVNGYCQTDQTAQLSADLLKELKIPIWTEMFDLRGMMGYKDNVLLSYTNARSSPFWVSGADLVAFRLPIGGWQFNFA